MRTVLALKGSPLKETLKAFSDGNHPIEHALLQKKEFKMQITYCA